jgi:hypothetical protein
MSQRVLGELLGRTEDWQNKIENNRLPLDRLSVIRSVAEQLDVSIGDLLAEPGLVDSSQAVGARTIPALRDTLLSYTQLMPFMRSAASARPVQPLAQLDGRLKAVWDAYQASRIALVSASLPPLIADLDAAVDRLESQGSERARLLLSSAYHAAATVLTKVGEVDLAWVAAQRGFDIAQRLDEPLAWLSLARSVAHVMAASGRYVDAATLVENAVTHVGRVPDDASSEYLSVYGTIYLTGAMAAANAEDRALTSSFLAESSAIADQLGRDGNYAWTAFGPTNVAIHRVSTAMELGDVETALALGSRIDTSPLPIERQVRHSLELARALNARGKREKAEELVLTAEARAPEQVRHHSLCRNLVINWIRTAKARPSEHLTGLAERMKLVSVPLP